MSVVLLLVAWAFAQDAVPVEPAPPPPPEPPAAPPPAAPDLSAPPVAPSGIVSKVEVVGLRRIEEAVLLDAILLRTGEPLAAWKIQRDIKAVWNTGYVDDVVVSFVDPSAEAKIVRFTVHEKPAVREVRITGAKKIKEEDLREAIDIESFTVPSEARIAQNARAIRDKYLEKLSLIHI